MEFLDKIDKIKSAVIKAASSPDMMTSIKKQIAESKDVMSEDDREEWVIDTQDFISCLFATKFKAGQSEHGGDLGEVTIKALLDHMEQEAIDQLAYVREIKRRLNIK